MNMFFINFINRLDCKLDGYKMMAPKSCPKLWEII